MHCVNKKRRKNLTMNLTAMRMHKDVRCFYLKTWSSQLSLCNRLEYIKVVREYNLSYWIASIWSWFAFPPIMTIGQSVKRKKGNIDECIYSMYERSTPWEKENESFGWRKSRDRKENKNKKRKPHPFVYSRVAVVRREKEKRRNSKSTKRNTKKCILYLDEIEGETKIEYTAGARVRVIENGDSKATYTTKKKKNDAKNNILTGKNIRNWILKWNVNYPMKQNIQSI